MWLTAFPPAPPTPITLMIGPVTSLSTISNMLLSPCRLKVALKPLPHAPQNALYRPALSRKLSVLHLRSALEQQAHRGGEARIAHHVREPSLVLRQAQAHRHVEDLFAKLHHAVHRRRAAREDDPARKQLFES